MPHNFTHVAGVAAGGRRALGDVLRLLRRRVQQENKRTFCQGKVV